jgi:hypothetical protein
MANEKEEEASEALGALIIGVVVKWANDYGIDMSHPQSKACIRDILVSVADTMPTEEEVMAAAKMLGGFKQ